MFLEGLFSNIGEKLQKAAVVLFWVTVVASFIVMFVLIDAIPYPYGFEDYWYVIFLPVVGSLLGLISAWCLHGFGQLVDNVETLVYLQNRQSTDDK